MIMAEELLLKKLCEKTMLIIVTHDESILNEIDETIYIWDGKLKKDKHREIV
jgi:ABC-type lipoprotein export system ATPase subunit